MPAQPKRRTARWSLPVAGMAIILAAHAGAAQGQDAAKEDAATDAPGRRLFIDQSCGTCHALQDAGGAGSVGPSLDGNAELSADRVAAIVTDGQGAMPPFGGQLTKEQIARLAAYIVAARK